MLFEDAYKVLEKLHADNPDLPMNEDTFAKGRIDSLEEYFTHIGHLAKYHTDQIAMWGYSNATFQKSAKFLMLPMDEKHNPEAGCFYIDLNSRNIQVPSVYVKNGVSVTGDQLAETLMFKVPRYFDYTDLTSTEIYVQWTNPAGQEGASRIVLVDHESEPGYILFGWPLTSTITVEGKNPLKFSVRFFIRDSITKTIKYSLNTLASSVSIKQALYTNFNNDLQVDDPASLFATAIKNGLNSNVTLAMVPEFFDEFVLPEKMSLDLTTDSLEMIVSGGSPDTGTVNYVWTYLPRYVKNNQVVSRAEDPQMYEETNKVYREKPVSVTEPLENRIYWEMTSDGKYIITSDEAFKENKKYYELVNVYTIYSEDTDKADILSPNVKYWDDPDEGHHISGEYIVRLINYIGANSTEGTQTRTCIVPCIEYVKFDTNLNSHSELMKVSDDNYETTLSVTVAVNDDAAKVYTWYKKTLDGDFEEITDADEDYCIVTEPGWYKVKVVGVLNREEMWNESAECKVHHAIKAPVIAQHTIDDIEVVGSNGTIMANKSTGEILDLAVNINELTDLEKDEVTFNWFRNTVTGDGIDSNGIPVSLDQTDVLAIEGNHLRVKASGVDLYYCVITNKLAGKTAETTSDAFLITST